MVMHLCCCLNCFTSNLNYGLNCLKYVIYDKFPVGY